ncbi:cyclic nucleotide-binding domain-containing protein, partial [Candidatus Poribacteria bacterium]|nr:cyclic nucleotide-binding domain-containing protein [Candidatus Poribacteria bacterium]
ARPTTPRDALELLDGVLKGEVTTAQMDATRPHAVSDTLETRQVSFSELPVHTPLLETVIQDRSLNTSPRRLEKNEVLFYEDDVSREAYILVSGVVEVLKAGRQLAVIDRAGSWLGEMSTLLNAPRTATIRATGETLLLRVDETNFRQFMHRHPEMCFTLAETLADRLEKLNRKYRESERKLAVIRRHSHLIERELGSGAAIQFEGEVNPF